MTFDLALYESFLAEERMRLGVVKFDPKKHPRDRLGRWTELAGLLQKRGTSTAWAHATPDVKIGFVGRGFSVIGPKGGQHRVTADTPEEAAKAVAKLTSNPDADIRPGVDPVEAHLIDRYQDASWSLNKTLREDKKLSGKNKKIASALDSVMGKKKTRKEKTLYRTVPADYAKSWRRGQVIEDKGYMSTADNPKGAFGAGQNPTHASEEKTLLHIVTPSGTPFAPTRTDEIVLPRGTKFKVLNKSKESHPRRDKTITVINVEIIR